MMTSQKTGVFYLLLLLLTFSLAPNTSVSAEQQTAADVSRDGGELAVMEAFTRNPIIEGEAVRIEQEQKHQILFFMGVSLLILILLTAYYGIAMGVYGKQVFVRHMILAGLSVTLAIAHSVVAVVWFFPF